MVTNLVVDRLVQTPKNTYEIEAIFYSGDADRYHTKVLKNAAHTYILNVVNLFEKVRALSNTEENKFNEPPYDFVPESMVRHEVYLRNRLAGIPMGDNVWDWCQGDDDELDIEDFEIYELEGFWPIDEIRAEIDMMTLASLNSYQIFYYDSLGNKYHVEKVWEHVDS